MSIFSKFFNSLRQGFNGLRRSGPVQIFLVSMCGLGILSRFWPRMKGSPKYKGLNDAEEGSIKKDDGVTEERAEGIKKDDGVTEERAEGENESEDSRKYKPKSYAFKEKSLRDFGYHFNENGELRNIKTGEAFEFQVQEDHKYNQKRYEAVGEIIDEHIYGLLEEDLGLKRLHVPVGAQGAPQSFIFVSDDYETNKDKLMILIHGSGVVRAGQWARRLIINDNLNCGTQIPFIKRAREEGYAIVVLNTNLNKVDQDGREKWIEKNGTPEQHGEYVWGEIISKLPAKHIAIVAHSYGGVVTTSMASEFSEEFDERVFAIAFTDSVHSLQWSQAPESVAQLFCTRGQNWVTSDDPVDTPIRQSRNDAPRVSAGHNKHEWTSWSSFESIFRFFNKKYSEASEIAKADL